MTHVPYRGAGPAVQDLAAGNVDMLFSSYVSAIGQVQAGKLARLGFTGPEALADPARRADHGRGRAIPTSNGVWHGIVAPLGHARQPS